MKKIVEYAYPSSELAARFRMSRTGCYVVKLLDEDYNGNYKKAFRTKEEAIKYGETLIERWHWLHIKYPVN